VVAVGVGFAVLLMSVAFGVARDINNRLSAAELQRVASLTVHQVNQILAALTVVITAAMLAETAAVTFVVGVTVMRSRREEIAVRRQSGVLRSRLILEFVQVVAVLCVIGGVVGEVAGYAAGVVIEHNTVLPVRFTAVSLLAAFPVTVALAVAATVYPAWRAASVSPALLRRE
jgi:ABC-type antimicrobial peptide transport system permease subunit